jgi:hypothetical protein
MGLSTKHIHQLLSYLYKPASALPDRSLHQYSQGGYISHSQLADAKKQNLISTTAISRSLDFIQPRTCLAAQRR